MSAATIAAIATGGDGAIGIVRLSGEAAIDIVTRIFSPKRGGSVAAMRGYTGCLGTLRDSGGDIDEAVLFIYRAPRSYTGEDCAELCCHGGRYILERALAAAIKAGASPAAPGEFTKRALMNGKLELTQAESIVNLISSENEQSLRAAMTARQGALHKRITEVADRLSAAAAHLAAWTDYPEEDVPELSPQELCDTVSDAADTLRQLIAGYGSGRMVREGISTAIVGAVNVGKSTLMNLLSGCEKSIVTELPGTTRDVVEERVRLGNISLLLRDTAGLRDTDDAVERIGVGRSLAALESCDLVLAVFDGSRPLTPEDKELLTRLEGRAAIAVVNKSDLPAALEREQLSEISRHVSAVVHISARQGDGLPTLEAAISEAVGIARLDSEAPALANARQLACAVAAEASLSEALSALCDGATLDAVSVCVEEALGSLLELTGARASEKIIERVFADFCVGK